MDQVLMYVVVIAPAAALMLMAAYHAAQGDPAEDAIGYLAIAAAWCITGVLVRWIITATPLWWHG